jgi:hypothetical protein
MQVENELPWQSEKIMKQAKMDMEHVLLKGERAAFTSADGYRQQKRRPVSRLLYSVSKPSLMPVPKISLLAASQR